MPPGGWTMLAQWISRRDGYDLDADVKLLFALSNAMIETGDVQGRIVGRQVGAVAWNKALSYFHTTGA
jgi:hypothetical protein